jgi:DeoR/GlpR family transcriptional regulator of sugar metabolism
MLEGIFGNATVEKVLLSVFHYGEIHAQSIAGDFKVALNPIRRQLDRLEKAGILISRPSGRMRLYQFNPKSPYTKDVTGIIEKFYYSLPLREREDLFPPRKPRRKGKALL